MATMGMQFIERLLGDSFGSLRGEVTALQDELRQSEFTNELLTERMSELELALEDAGWMRLMFDGGQGFSADGLRKIRELARLMFVKNPLIKRGVMVKALYVWAQGINIRAKQPEINTVIHTFWDDEKNRAELTSHQAQMLKEIDLQVDGRIYFVFFVRPSDGRVRVRTLPVDEIASVICDPEDAKSPWFYVRTWNESQFNVETGRTKVVKRTCYYPDWRYNPTKRPAKIGNHSIEWDTPVYAISTTKYGESEVYAAIDWARAYKEFLEDVASLMRAYSRFAWKVTTKGGKKGVAAVKSKLASTVGEGISVENNPSPVTGAAAVMADGVDMNPIQLRGASISPDDGRRFLLMAAGAFGIPETYYGDVSVGTLATAKTMDRPTELMMVERQQFWTDVYRDIFRFVILQAMKANKHPLQKLGAVSKTQDNGEIEETIVWDENVSLHLDIDFPPILERDVQAAVQAVVTALTLNGQSFALLDDVTATRLVLNALGEDDVDEIMADLFPDETRNASESGASKRETIAARRLAEAIIQTRKESGEKADG